MTQIKQLETLLQQGKISRRDFLKRAGAVGAVGAAPLSMLGTAPAFAAKRGGRLRLGLAGGSTDDTLDPGTITDFFMQVLTHAIRNNVTEIAPDGSLVGDLAESWEGKPGAKEWNFVIRRGVEFHNGKTLTAADVVASLRHHIRPDSTSAMKGPLEQIESLRALSPRLMQVKLKTGNADFPYTLTDYHLGVWPEDESPLQGTGTGPFILGDFEPGVRASARRNPNYHKEGRPFFDDLAITAIEDASARSNALRAGEVDAINRVEYKTANLMDRLPGINVFSITGTGHYTIPMFADVEPFDDVNVRRALRWAIDREALLKTIINGHGAVGNDLPIARHQPFYNTSLEQRTYDPDKAKFYLKQAGLSSLDVQVSTADAAFSGAVDAAVLYKEHAAKAGINIDVVRESSDGYWSNVWLKKPWVFCFWGGRPTQDQMWTVAYQKGADWNDNHWYNDRFQNLLLQARAEVNEELRREMYWEMQELHWDEGATIVPLFNNFVSGVSSKIATTGTISGTAEMDGYRATERWWFA